MIFLFCLDTSASMNQRTTNGVRVIDAAKAGVEYFMLKRANDPSYPVDRFFLVTFEDGLAAIKVRRFMAYQAGWEEDTSDFLRELKSLQAFDMSDAGAALKKSFDLLNSNRVNSIVDTFGMGRQPWTLEPAVVIMLTDGGMMTELGAPMMEFVMPAGSSYYGSELYREPFRWDQRLHALLLKFTSNQSPQPGVQPKQPALQPMAQATGGSCVSVTSMRHMIHAMDTILNEHASRKPVSVAMQFEAMSVPNTPPSHAHPPPSLIQHVLVKSTGNWPLPEDYTLSPTMTTLPARTALPRIMYRPISIVAPKPPMPQFPIDVYDLEASPLVDWMTEHVSKGYALECSLVSGRDQTAPHNIPPFGVLAMFPDGAKLLVMPYNFQALNGLLMHYQSRTIKWKADFDKYLAALPPYYVPPLKNALRNVPMQSAPILLSGPPVHPYNLVPDTMVAVCKELPTDVVKWLDDIKDRAKAGRSTLLTEIANTRKLQQLSMQNGSSASLSSLMSSSLSRAGSITRSHLLIQMEALRSRLHTIAPQLQQKIQQSSYRSDEDEAKHHVPIGEMGDYQTYLARKPAPLKTIEGPDSSTPGKPYFGNPFTKGDAGAFVDEVGVSSSSSPSSAPNNRRKRKRKFGIGERADKLKQFVLSDGNSASSSASASASTSTTASPSAPTPSTIPSTPEPPSSPIPAPPAIPQPPPSTTITQSFIEQQRTRKERLHKWDSIIQTPQVHIAPALIPEIASTQALLKVAHANNALKLTVVSALNCQAAPNEQVLKKCWSELQGNTDTKRKALQEWISLGLLFHVDLAPLISTFLTSH